MRPGTFDWALFAASLAAYAVATLFWLRRDQPDFALLGLVGVAGSVVVFLVRSGLDDTSVRGSLRTATVLNIAILLATRGRPSDLFDFGDPKGKEFRRMSKAQRAEVEKRGHRRAIAQGTFLLFVIIGAGVYTFSGWTFLD